MPTRSRLIAALALCGLNLAFRTALYAAPNAPQQMTLTLLHDNDLHGHLLPFAYVEIGQSKLEKPSVGGAARRATLIRRLRQEIKNATMLIDSGDTFTRGPLTNAYEGIADTEAMNAVGYELAAVGNNEFKAKDGVDQTDAAGAQTALLQIVKRSRFPWICANATDGKGAILEGVQPYVVRDFGGVRVGFLGLTSPKSMTYPQTKGWTITDPIAAAKQWIPEARKHCDVLIAVTHIGVLLDTLLAAQTAKVAARKRWMVDHLQLRGTVVVDDGAALKLREEGKSLLPIGVREVEGEFHRGDVIAVRGLDGRMVARGLANYSSAEARLIARKPSSQIEAALGYANEPELVHRDNLVLG